MASTAMIWCAISRMALRPSWWRRPAWEGRPRVRIVNSPAPFLAVTILPPSRAGSVTSTYLLRLASASMAAREVGLPTSSSGT